MGSSIRYTFEAPAPIADSRIARRSTWVEPLGTRFTNRAPLDLGRAAGHADDDPRTGAEYAGFEHLADEVLEHQLGDSEVGDHTVLERPDRPDAVRGAAEHALGGEAHGLDYLLGVGPVLLPDCDNRGFIKDNPLAAHVDKGVGGTEINGDILGIEAGEKVQHGTFEGGARPRSRRASRHP